MYRPFHTKSEMLIHAGTVEGEAQTNLSAAILDSRRHRWRK